MTKQPTGNAVCSGMYSISLETEFEYEAIYCRTIFPTCMCKTMTTINHKIFNKPKNKKKKNMNGVKKKNIPQKKTKNQKQEYKEKEGIYKNMRE